MKTPSLKCADSHMQWRMDKTNVTALWRVDLERIVDSTNVRLTRMRRIKFSQVFVGFELPIHLTLLTSVDLDSDIAMVTVIRQLEAC
jgi:hypothetical protein